GYRDYDRARAELVQAERLLPNNVQALQLSAFIDRRQGRWDEAINQLKHALELDPRNTSIGSELGATYYRTRRYADDLAVTEQMLQVDPTNVWFRLLRGFLESDRTADLKPLRDVLSSLEAESPATAREVSSDALGLALWERNPSAIDRVLARLPREGALVQDGVKVPYKFWEGWAAELRDDVAGAHAAFTAARAQLAADLAHKENHAPSISFLGLIEAHLGEREEALRHGRRACELLPVEQDAVVGPELVRRFAAICARLGEKEVAITQLHQLVPIPGGASYAELRLNPDWDLLRDDPRFQKIVAGLEPKPVTNRGHLSK
ncbi:MAG: tetratricopeptide repeat protein, partial [Verrucomicrobiota bacterium]|nr:tetratricopeptide repeat protein [Verrucomicrobiota bacterium]